MGDDISPLPDTPLARAAAQLLIAAAPKPLVEHSFRSHRFGSALLAGRDHDAEALYVAACFHDLGLTSSHDDGRTPFEEIGASLAYRYLADASDARAELVRDAILLHLDLETADDPRPEVAALHLGASADVVGLRLDQIDATLVETILAAHPRTGCKATLIEAMRGQAASKPASKAAFAVERFKLLDLIAAAPFDD